MSDTTVVIQMGERSGFSFVVPGTPVPWARTRISKIGHFFTPEVQRMYALTVQDAARQVCDTPLTGPLRLEVQAVYAWPKADKKRICRWKCSRPDIDNLGKIVADALNGVVWKDDAQIAALHVWKYYDDEPCLKVRVGALT